MADTNSNRPNLPEAILSLEQSVLVGDVLAMGTYGIMATIFVQAVLAMLKRKKGSKSPLPWTILAYTCTVFAVSSTYMFLNLHCLKLMFILNREKVGGPTAYALSVYGDAVTMVANCASIIGTWLTDGFLLYRCLVIFQLQPAIVAIPIVIYLGVVAMGIMVLYQASRPGGNLWTRITLNFGIPYFAGSAFFNVLITVMIATKLIIHRRKLRKLSAHEFLKLGHVVTILIESSALCATFSTLVVVPYGIGSHISSIFIPISTIMQVLATMLIIWRVATRRAWESNATGATRGGAARDATSVLFAAGPNSMEESTVMSEIQSKGSHRDATTLSTKSSV